MYSVHTAYVTCADTCSGDLFLVLLSCSSDIKHCNCRSAKWLQVSTWFINLRSYCKPNLNTCKWHVSYNIWYMYGLTVELIICNFSACYQRNSWNFPEASLRDSIIAYWSRLNLWLDMQNTLKLVILKIETIIILWLGLLFCTFYSCLYD